MPAKFRLELARELYNRIKGQTAAVRSKRQSGEWIPYPQFIEKLAKGMNTIAEEAHHYTTGMAGESGELIDITKKSWIYEKPLDIEHILEEMGDLRWYYQGMLNLLGLTDEDIQAVNTVKLLKRYPDGVYSNERAIARADKAAPGSDRKFFGKPVETRVPLNTAPHFPEPDADPIEQDDRRGVSKLAGPPCNPPDTETAA